MPMESLTFPRILARLALIGAAFLAPGVHPLAAQGSATTPAAATTTAKPKTQSGGQAQGATARQKPPPSKPAPEAKKPTKPAATAPKRPASAPSVQSATAHRVPQITYNAPPFVTRQFQPGELTAIKAAIAAAENGQLEQAMAAAGPARHPVLQTLLTYLWIVRPGSVASVDDILSFQNQNPDWPSQDVMRRRAEGLLADDPSDYKVLTYFQSREPLTGEGRFRLAEAQFRAGLAEDAGRNLRRGWIAGNFGQREESDALQKYGHVLRDEDHAARLDRLIWDGDRVAARRMMARVDGDRRALADARLALQEMAPNVEGLIARLPPQLQSDPALVYERVRWRRIKNLDEDAQTLLLSQGPDVPYPEKWWTERQFFARRALTLGSVSDAYRLAAVNGIEDPRLLAESEFLAGWIALRYLGEGKQALKHFTKLAGAVRSPISQARGAYWAGRAAEAAGDRGLAETWYRKAAEHGVAYYGQLAAARVNQQAALRLPADPQVTQADMHNFERRSLVRATVYLAAAERRDRMRAFIMRLNDTATSEAEHLLVADFAEKLGRVDLGVAAAKRSASNGVTLTSRAFPVVTQLANGGGEPEAALTLALSRQESEFRPDAVSRAGARGLMQLMPATAQAMAKSLGVGYREPALTADPDYNVSLGRHYLRHLLDNYNGHYVLTLAAYNAGPGRVRQWVQTWGDPRNDNVDVIDWIELIPFTETRNYVQRVIEGVQVYRQLLNPRATVELRIQDDLKGRRGL